MNETIKGNKTEQSWYPDVEPAEQLLERILIERRKKWEAAELAKMEAKGKASKNDKWKKRYKDIEPPIEVDLPYIPDEWLWVRLDTVAEIKGGITKDRKRVVKSAIELPYLRVANVQRGYLDLEDIKYIQISKEKIPEFLLEEGDILFNEGGDIDKLGRGWIWEGQIERCTFQNHVFRARLYVNEIQEKWISWFSNTFGQRYFMAEGKQTTNLASINKTMLSAFPVPLPPIDEQSELIREIEKKYSVIEKIEKDLDDRFTMAENLRRSILKKAFTGKLVPQDPKDEPASVLIQKIKDEIKEIKKAPKKRRLMLRIRGLKC
ncbi:restriction endonuclease subunit S [uncultured Desulfobacter sp.]|uniref:restriction endonuclease subunit S n=1 Tax=uncultured Desulfobacter sp. TaxID=240139 RepID=UPI002AA94AD5|nr:restriction endonuclease subunit S [uncultured Desulfobacter sp.]